MIVFSKYLIICFKLIDKFLTFIPPGEVFRKGFPKPVRRGELGNWGLKAIATMLLGFLADGIGTEPCFYHWRYGSLLTGIIYFLSIKNQRPMLDEIYKERCV